jgi:hypothetical protein
MRLILDRILPIEEKMKHQIEKMMKMSATGQSDENDKSNYRANVADLEVRIRKHSFCVSVFFFFF